MKKFLTKHEQVIRYLFFGITTTVVGWVVYFAVLFCGKAVFDIESSEIAGGEYLAVYSVAQVLQWIASVVVAFFTNRKWVFKDASTDRSTLRQMGVFAGGRVLTFIMDYVVTYAGALALCALIPAANHAWLFGREWNLNEIAAKLIAAVLVIIGNYFFSKKFVFTEKE